MTETSSVVFQEAERVTATVARDVRMEAGEPEIVYEQHIPHGLETTVELLTRDCLAQKDFSFGTCEKVMQLVCGLAKSLRKRSFQEGTESIAQELIPTAITTASSRRPMGFNKRPSTSTPL